MAIVDGNSSFILAQAIVVLPTSLGAVRSAEGDRNMHLPGSLKRREHMLPHTGPVETSKFPPVSPSVSQLTSVFSCPSGMSIIWMAEIFPSLPPMSTSRPSPVPIHKLSPPFPKGSPPTLPGKQRQNCENEEELHISQETDEKRPEMKVEVDPLRGFKRK